MSKKWMIASDLHGSAYYCRLLLERFDEEKADRLIFLGDLLYHGPRNDLPKEYDTKAVTKLLNGVKDKLLCVKGNCDSEVDLMIQQSHCWAYTLRKPEGKETRVPQCSSQHCL